MRDWVRVVALHTLRSQSHHTTGFTSLGSLAAEVADPKKTMIRVVTVLIPTVILVNCLPLMAALSRDDNYQDY